ncbi:hypothetical protein ACFRCI_19270 [Streptomyces sp. NPDC056638]|uniref:hypothetical protein n=1 Tax=Streptomyces sp. NPDC056638 TaxID=3345887 RepID=UPI003696DB85
MGRSSLHELQQRGVDYLRVRPGDVVRTSLHRHEGEVLINGGSGLGGVLVAKDAVVLVVDADRSAALLPKLTTGMGA